MMRVLFMFMLFAAQCRGQLGLSAAPDRFVSQRVGANILPALGLPGSIEALVTADGYPDGPSWLQVTVGENRTLVLAGTAPSNVTSIACRLVLVSPALNTAPFSVSSNTQAPGELFVRLLVLLGWGRVG